MKRVHPVLPALLCVAALISASCSSSDSSPTEPSSSTPSPSNSPAPAPAPAPAPTPAPGPTVGSVSIEIEPNPVPFSGQPITDSAGCAGSKNTWFYDQKLIESGGVDVVFTQRIDKFDGRVVNTLSGQNIQVKANTQTRIKSRWCSSNAVFHTAQTTFSGSDAKGNPITVEGPVANMQSP
jgi:hypothetical protein